MYRFLGLYWCSHQASPTTDAAARLLGPARLESRGRLAHVLRWRPLGGGDYRTVPLRYLARGVYNVELPAGQADFEYHLEARTAGGRTLLWPATAPDRNQTVVVWGK